MASLDSPPWGDVGGIRFPVANRYQNIRDKFIRDEIATSLKHPLAFPYLRFFAYFVP